MKRILVPALFVTAFALPAQAFEWPWQSSGDVNYGFCKGFAMAGLANDQIASSSRTDLWLTWNYIGRTLSPDGGISETDFEEGRDHFLALITAADFDSIREVKESQCYLGRNNHSPEGEFSKS